MVACGNTSRKRVFGTTLLAGVLAICASSSARADPPASGQDAASAQYADTALIDKKYASEPGFMGLYVQTTLARAGFFMRPFTAVFDERTRAAIREFQKASGLPASGAFDEQTNKRMAEFNAALNDDPSLPNFEYRERISWDGSCSSATDERCVHIEASGSWLGEDLVPEFRTNVIECDMGLGTCRDTQASVGPFGRQMDVNIDNYEIQRANSEEILTRPLEFSCVEYVLYIDRVKKRVTKVRRTKVGGRAIIGDCSKVEQRELHMYLGHGLYTDKTGGKRTRDALRFLGLPAGVLKPESEYTSKKKSSAR